jgi:transcriptional regulator with XRE-family HTH domain
VSPRTPFSANLGATIRARRRAIGLSTTSLGCKVGVAPLTISAWERGDRALTMERFHAVATALDIDEGGAIDAARGGRTVVPTPRLPSARVGRDAVVALA